MFSLSQAHFANQIISMLNTYGQIDAFLRVDMSSGQIDVRLEPLSVETRNVKPTVANSKFQTEQVRMKDKAKLIVAQLKAKTIVINLNEIK